jgi:phasin family protein
MATKRITPESGKPETLMPKSYFDVDALLKMQQRNIETMVEANRIFVDAAQAIARCQSDMMKDCVEQMTRAFTSLAGQAESHEATAKAAPAVQILFEKTAGHVRDIAELVSKSNADAIQLVNGRMKSLMDEARATGATTAERVAAE